ncbi:flagellar biosynthesis anti-sigma factor FlgM [Halobacillus sp. KGW1]|uniref:flagellar biosynthesis anti-sigma factor FlgM n=1 Tax=Halobacillus sp. KGW1 TaxID=1793726 RepID=UPI0007830BB7|nr:flagellar biosynthesis anti-sigma factor FlgM [Halobacillus sp. KGW1]
MKINGPNSTNFNPYQKQIQKQPDVRMQQKNDQLHISKEAKMMQEADKPDQARMNLIEKIKADIDSDQYKVDTNAVAKKMLDFWSTKE